MKKIISLILAIVIAVSLISCSSSGGSADKMARILDPLEYTLYTNVFYNGEGDKYVNANYTKEGIFAVIHDDYSSIQRYYVWGYSDETLCCDWQWEFVPENPDDLPEIGSHVKVSGKFARNAGALDGYWMENAKVEVISEYKAAAGKYDTTTMSPTLARVQLINLKNFISKHQDEQVVFYGRIKSGDKLQHPYYNETWEIKLECEDELPAIGTYVTVSGKFTGTSSSDSKIVVEKIKAD